MKYKVMITEDEQQIRDVVGKYFESAGYDVFLYENGIDTLADFGEVNPHLVILDVMMPGISGFEVLKELRMISQVPVIMLTAKQKEEDRIEGFDLGADDYVPKPFSPKELVKRAEAVLRRTYSAINDKKLLVCGNLTLDTAKMKLYKDNREIEITSNEYSLLEVLFSNVGILLTRSRLVEKAFGYDYDGFERNIDSYIKNIRHKIEDDSKKPRYLKTKYGAGYIFEGDSNDS